jgi:outer membrane receptor protein involved in Fe transport
MIDRVYEDGVQYYRNVDRASSRGVESGFDFSLDPIGLSVGGDYTFTRATDDGEDRPLPDVPTHRIDGALVQQFLGGGKARVSSQWVIQPHSASGAVMDSYFTMSGMISYRWRWLAVALGARNLFDTDYVTESGYPMPGRTLRAELGVLLERRIGKARYEDTQPLEEE